MGNIIRPADFELDTDHHLAHGLVFGGFGRIPRTSRYLDESLRRNNGDLVGYADPRTGWKYDAELGRYVNVVTANNTAITFPAAGEVGSKGRSVFALSAWVNAANYSTFRILWADYTPEQVRFTVRIQDLTGWKLAVRGRQTDTDSFTTFFTTDVANLPTAGTWWRLTVAWNAPLETVEVFANGNSFGTASIVNTAFGTEAGFTGAHMGNSQVGGEPWGRFGDPIIHNRALALPEIRRLASRDPMYGGLLYDPSADVAAYDVRRFRPWYRRPSSQIIGAGT